jgi:hypothetical protein
MHWATASWVIKPTEAAHIDNPEKEAFVADLMLKVLVADKVEEPSNLHLHRRHNVKAWEEHPVRKEMVRSLEKMSPWMMRTKMKTKSKMRRI